MSDTLTDPTVWHPVRHSGRRARSYVSTSHAEIRKRVKSAANLLAMPSRHVRHDMLAQPGRGCLDVKHLRRSPPPNIRRTRGATTPFPSHCVSRHVMQIEGLDPISGCIDGSRKDSAVGNGGVLSRRCAIGAISSGFFLSECATGFGPCRVCHVCSNISRSFWIRAFPVTSTIPSYFLAVILSPLSPQLGPCHC